MLLLGMSVVFNSCEKENNKEEKVKDTVWVLDRIEFVFMGKVVHTEAGSSYTVFSPTDHPNYAPIYHPCLSRISLSSKGTATCTSTDSNIPFTVPYSKTDKGYMIDHYGQVEYELSSNGELCNVVYETAIAGLDKWRKEDIISIGNFNGPLIFTNIRCVGENCTNVFKKADIGNLFFYEYKNGTRIPLELVGFDYQTESRGYARYEDIAFLLPQGIIPPASYDSANKQVYWWRHVWKGENYSGEDDWSDAWLDSLNEYSLITLGSFDYAFEYKRAVYKPEK